jgi:hypothetical protein
MAWPLVADRSARRGLRGQVVLAGVGGAAGLGVSVRLAGSVAAMSAMSALAATVTVDRVYAAWDGRAAARKRVV